MTKNLDKPEVICIDQNMVERSEAEFDNDYAHFPDQDVFNENNYAKDQESLLLYSASLPGNNTNIMF